MNHHDSRLHTKRLKGQDGVYSYRITRRYRELFYISQDDVIVVFAIAHRKDIYQ